MEGVLLEVRKTMAAGAMSPAASSSAGFSSRDHFATPSGPPLPAWRKEVDEKSGQEYYYNDRTNETLWEKPEGFV